MPYKNREDMLKNKKKYYQKHKKEIAIYNSLPEVKAKRAYNQRVYNRKHRHKLNAESKIRCKKHYQSNKLYYKSKKAKRDRNLGFTKLVENDWNEPIDWHHVDNEHVVPLPRYLHKLCYTGDRETHRKLCNKLVKILYGDIL